MNAICPSDVRANLLRPLCSPPDPILGVTEKFKADKSPKKINLGVGKSFLFLFTCFPISLGITGLNLIADSCFY